MKDNWPTIVNETGIGRDTKILLPSGEALEGIRKISIEIVRDDLVLAQVELIAKVDIKAFINEIEQHKGDE